MPLVLLSLGCNLGDRFALMRAMQDGLADVLAPPLGLSPLMETEPLGMPAGTGWFLNRVVRGQYQGSAPQLLMQCQAIEKALGRTGKGANLSRTADIDILLFGSDLIDLQNLTIPHPAIPQRRYCLEGLAHLVPQLVHPRLHRTFDELCRQMPSEVRNQQLRFID
jgi:2-amino-4-hydroxy-6-hydroxymethyldihydropteridine diphosphokinase